MTVGQVLVALTGPHGSLVRIQVPDQEGTEKFDGPPCGHSMGNATPWIPLEKRCRLEYRIRFRSTPPATPLAAVSLPFLQTRTVNDGFLMTSFPRRRKCAFKRIDVEEIVLEPRERLFDTLKKGRASGDERWNSSRFVKYGE